MAYAAGWPWLVAPAGGLSVAIWRYFGGLGLARSLLEVVETFTQKDLNQDGRIGKKQTEVKVVFKNPETRQWLFAELPGAHTDLIKLAASGEFTERSATNAGLTQEQFGILRDKFVDRRWAVWNHPVSRQQGVSLTLSGRAVLREIANSPLPDDERLENQL